MRSKVLYYHVVPNDNLPEGLNPVLLSVLSPVWRGPLLIIEYPDGLPQTITGWTAIGLPCDLRVFWTQASEGGPTVCLAIGGDGGVRLVDDYDIHISGQKSPPPGQGRPFLALSESLIPPGVSAIIGPAPPRAPLLLL
ncbi:MAG: hypothetical protein FJ135_16005 [Deltaproteobacteria bacterium]|nr:hypothetical protein [Deltaproteobacteria bacterium]